MLNFLQISLHKPVFQPITLHAIWLIGINRDNTGRLAILAHPQWFKEMLKLEHAPTSAIPQFKDLEGFRLDLTDLDASLICSRAYRLVRTSELDKHLHLDENGYIHAIFVKNQVPYWSSIEIIHYGIEMDQKLSKIPG
jgi:hypothetical protein